MADRYRVHFRSHANSARIYTVVAQGAAPANFIAAALRNDHWIVLGTPERDEERPPCTRYCCDG